MDTTLVLTGILPFILITAGILSVILSAFLLRLYRRATLRGMARAANPNIVDAAATVPSVPITQQRESQPTFLRFHEITGNDSGNGTSARSISGSAVPAFIRRSQIYSTLIYLAAGFAYAFIMTLTWMVLAGGPPSPGRILMLMTLHLWPSVIAICIVSAIGLRETLTVLGTYLLLLTLTLVIVILRNPELSFASVLVLWFIVNLQPTLFFLFFLQNRIRSVGPLVFAFMLCGIAGSVVLIQAANQSDALLHLIIQIAQPLGLGSTSLFIVMQLTGFLMLAVVGWFLLRRIGEAYRRKRFSDRSITLDSMWLMFAVFQSIGFAFEGAVWILTAPAAYLAYRLVVNVGFRLAAAHTRPTSAPLELLLLRVFSLGRRSNRFFEKFSKMWRPVGIINMIAGPDLVTSAVEPHEFLEFAGGKLSRRFVQNNAELNQCLIDLDRKPDPDGRYRVHEFFCHDDTWRMTMQRLATESHAIVMDLRSFSESNQGCLFELKVLLDTIDLRRIVFIVDNTTNRGFLENALLTLWSDLSQQSPNAELSEPTVTLFTSENHSRQALKELISQLIQHAQSSVAVANMHHGIRDGVLSFETLNVSADSKTVAGVSEQ